MLSIYKMTLCRSYERRLLAEHYFIFCQDVCWIHVHENIWKHYVIYIRTGKSTFSNHQK